MLCWVQKLTQSLKQKQTFLCCDLDNTAAHMLTEKNSYLQALRRHWYPTISVGKVHFLHDLVQRIRVHQILEWTSSVHSSQFKKNELVHSLFVFFSICCCELLFFKIIATALIEPQTAIIWSVLTLKLQLFHNILQNQVVQLQLGDEDNAIWLVEDLFWLVVSMSFDFIHLHIPWKACRVL